MNITLAIVIYGNLCMIGGLLVGYYWGSRSALRKPAPTNRYMTPEEIAADKTLIGR